jgi:hypothetical protein
MRTPDGRESACAGSGRSCMKEREHGSSGPSTAEVLRRGQDRLPGVKVLFLVKSPLAIDGSFSRETAGKRSHRHATSQRSM